MTLAVSPCDITGLVLAGGRGARMGGADKGLQPVDGVPLALHALRRLAPQVGRTAINANRNAAVYASFGVPVWPDDLDGYAGPLAGFLTGLAHCETPWLLTVPCDTPRFPLDLARRLTEAVSSSGAPIAMADAPEPDEAQGVATLRPQPVFCLMQVALLGGLQQFTQDGGRKVATWAAQQHCVHVPFDRAGDAPDAFVNANTLAELRALEQARRWT